MRNPLQFFKRKTTDYSKPEVRQAQMEALKARLSDVQNTLTVLINNGEIGACDKTGNPYRNCDNAVKALAEKYEGEAQWGVQQIRNIIDVRSAFIIGQGIKLKAETGSDKEKDKKETSSSKEKSREMEFVEGFVKFCNLDEEMPQELAKEAEIEGRILVRIFEDVEKKKVSFRFIPYSVYKYKVETDPNDYEKFTAATYKDPNSQQDVKLKPGQFVYRRFAGRLSKVNEIMPKVAMVLRFCEDLDKALADWRKINKLFAAPTPYFKVTDANHVDSLMKKLKEINWTIGKLLVGTAEFSLVGAPTEGVNSLKDEIENLAKIISGGTGVPVHFLGFPDLMSNRSVSTDLFEFINASVNKERKIWQGFYQELFDTAIPAHNRLNNGNLQPGKVTAEIMMLTEAQLRLLSEVWLPLYTAGVIDLDYFLSKIPDLDPEKVKEHLDEAAKRMLESLKNKENDFDQDDPENDYAGSGSGKGRL